MKRRSIFAAVAALFAGKAAGQEKKQKYYVTCSQGIDPWEPIEVMATNRLDAIAHIGLTVWTEKEWLDAMREIGHMRPKETSKPCVSKETAR